MYLGGTKLFPTPWALRLAISFAWGTTGSTFPKSTQQPEWSFWERISGCIWFLLITFQERFISPVSWHLSLSILCHHYLCTWLTSSMAFRMFTYPQDLTQGLGQWLWTDGWENGWREGGREVRREGRREGGRKSDAKKCQTRTWTHRNLPGTQHEILSTQYTKFSLSTYMFQPKNIHGEMGTERIVRGTWYFELEGASERFSGCCSRQMNYFHAGLPAHLWSVSLELRSRSACHLSAWTGSVLGCCVGRSQELGIWVSCLNLTVCAAIT